MEERVSEDSGDGFAALLRELKDRSGLSYGTLAKRMHMSTSTLHRYCNGTAVPNDYAPVERLARLCKATPDELVELHRRWILADAGRGKKTSQAPPAIEARGPGQSPETSATSLGAASAHPRRRTALIASAAAAVVLGAVVLAVNLPSGGTGGAGGDGERQVARPGVTTSTTGTGRPHAGKSSAAPATPSPSGSGGARGGNPSAPAKSGGANAADPGGRDGGAAPLNVATRPYVYDSPCSQHFLVDSAPEQVGPPASEQDAPRWAAAYGAVSSGEQRVALTVQGTGKETVVLEDLHVRVAGKDAPLAWNDYSMGVGCGGNVGTKSFDIDLDNGSPSVTVKNGQRDFPYKVSESDPEVFYVTAHAKAHDVRWDLTLDWSSGTRHGTVHVDNDGTPFRTSGNSGRPGYDYPLGGSEWIERQGG
ncbi:transcriptional regulator [Streptomyces endophyticus]|uniref:Helix-turn-helix domain-containing protein n=1 Tax=Streptomyces endophyticus TaxID=714166 RepID=A0ABU6FE37_9ACTN|nr:helix-turn-helix domain-containing protein [Streptomyces endophyticus]MEB8341743.1 helix-turn-helix domain-containing protein [Streptomyces endophyticus]